MSDWDLLHDMHNEGYSADEIADAAAVGYAPWQTKYIDYGEQPKSLSVNKQPAKQSTSAGSCCINQPQARFPQPQTWLCHNYRLRETQLSKPIEDIDSNVQFVDLPLERA